MIAKMDKVTKTTDQNIKRQNTKIEALGSKMDNVEAQLNGIQKLLSELLTRA